MIFRLPHKFVIVTPRSRGLYSTTEPCMFLLEKIAILEKIAACSLNISISIASFIEGTTP